MKVELEVFSGRPNPTWDVTEDIEKLISIIRKLPVSKTHRQRFDGLGYRGFTISVTRDESGYFRKAIVYRTTVWLDKGKKTQVLEDSAGLVEKWLLNNAKQYINDNLWRNLKSEIEYSNR